MKKQIKTLLGVILSLVVAYLIARPCAIFLAESANNYVNKTESESIEKANLSLPSTSTVLTQLKILTLNILSKSRVSGCDFL